MEDPPIRSWTENPFTFIPRRGHLNLVRSSEGLENAEVLLSISAKYCGPVTGCFVAQKTYDRLFETISQEASVVELYTDQRDPQST